MDVDEEEDSKLFRIELIPEAATFKPTLEEFADPLEYIRKIRHIGEKYGVCKIKPPSSWKPSFCIDMKTFRFTPRVQRLNELEAGTRVKIQFLDKLSKFWELQGSKFRIPTVERKPLDIYQLYKAVDSMGGYENVVRNRRWSKVREAMNLKENNTSQALKAHYEKLLYPYILFEAGVTTTSSTSVAAESQNGEEEEEETSVRGKGGKRGRASSNKQQQQPAKKSSSSSAAAAARKAFEYDMDDIEQINCRACGRGDDEEFILLCDECDASYHTYCLYPALRDIPKGDWRCPDCVAEICKRPTDSYGFEQSKHQYSLNEFGDMANKFKTEYFRRPHNSVAHDEVEREFWRILSSPDETVEVEYGADLHTLEIGSGFPTNKYRGKTIAENFEEYLDSPWNLNNLALEEKSVLSQMNVDISGMKIPWAYVGMCFSCFCWHVEDHWSYSINYLHWGDTKTWYGVSADDADKFEAVMKANAPELFEKSPDLLHHLVTIMNPNLLVKNGVPIYRVNQNAGDFVITFPRAYHAGFNHGFNFAEAVNFCPADWLPVGRAAIDHYKQVKRNTVFSHDELVCKLANSAEPLDYDVLEATEREFARIIEYENRHRKELLKSNIAKIEIVQFELLPDDERTCDYCRTTCFVSALTCSCHPRKLVCLEHREHLCEHSLNSRSKSHQFLPLFRYSMEEIRTIHARLKATNHRYETWRANVENVLKARASFAAAAVKADAGKASPRAVPSSSEKYQLRHLLNLLEEARQNKYSSLAVQGSSGVVSNGKRGTRVKQEHNGQPEKLAMRDYLYQELRKEYDNSIKLGQLCEMFIKYYKSDANTAKGVSLKLSEAVDESGPRGNDHEAAADDKDDDDDDDEIIFVGKTASAKSRKRMSLEQIKKQMAALQNLVCELPEAEPFKRLFAEVLDNESTLERLVRDWDLGSPAQLKRAVEYLDRICVQFPSELVESVRLMQAQAEWLQAARQARKDPGRLTLAELKGLIDRVVRDDLHRRPKQAPGKAAQLASIFVDINQLYSHADHWDKKIKALLNSRTASQLDVLEKTLAEAKSIPVSLESVKELEKCVATAKQINQTITQLGKGSKKNAHLNDLLETVRLASALPIKLKKVQELEIKINMATNWIHGLCDLFLKAPAPRPALSAADTSVDKQASPADGQWGALDQAALVELLTPRQDLAPLVNKLKAACVNFYNLPPEVTAKGHATPVTNGSAGATPGKRTRKAAAAAAASQAESSGGLLDAASLSFSADDERSLSTLKCKSQALQFREAEQIKQLRALNREKLKYILSELNSSGSGVDSASNGQTGGGDSATTGAEAIVNIKAKLSALPNFCLKCCSCSKSMLSSLQSANFNQCALCLGLFHHMCKGATNRPGATRSAGDDDGVPLCAFCERSKRPDIMLVYDQLLGLERLELSSIEGHMLQILTARYQDWQERVSGLFGPTSGNNNSLRQLRSLVADMDALTSSQEKLEEFKQAYASLSAMKKVELNELHLEGLLQEAHSEDLVLLNKIVTLASQVTDGDLCEQLKAKLSRRTDGGSAHATSNGKSCDERTGKNNKAVLVKSKSGLVKKLDRSALVKMATKHGKENGGGASSKLAKQDAAAKKSKKKSIEKAKLNSLNKKLKKSRSGNLDSELRSSIEATNRAEIYDLDEEGSDGDGDDDEANEEEEDEEAVAGAEEEESDESDDNASEEVCAVDKCLRPTGSIKWVQCDGGCNRWFHLACVGLTRISKKDNYWCPTCSEKRTEVAAEAKPAEADDDSQLSNTSSSGTKRTRSRHSGVSESKRFKESGDATESESAVELDSQQQHLPLEGVEGVH